MDDWNIAIMWDLNRTSRLFECHRELHLMIYQPNAKVVTIKLFEIESGMFFIYFANWIEFLFVVDMIPELFC